MRLPTEAEEQLRELGELLAQQKIEALNGACCLMFAEIFRVLMADGRLAPEEFEQTLAKVEAQSVAMKSISPELSGAVSLMTLNLREAFQPRPGSPN